MYPDAAVVISYRIPTYKVGRRRLYIGAWQHGLSVYGWPQERDDFITRHPELKSSKGTIRLSPQDAAGLPLTTSCASWCAPPWNPEPGYGRGVPDAIFAHHRLAQVYDAFDGPRDDLPAYLAIAGELGADRVLDVGCGTGCLALLLAAAGLHTHAPRPTRPRPRSRWPGPRTAPPPSPGSRPTRPRCRRLALIWPEPIWP